MSARSHGTTVPFVTEKVGNRVIPIVSVVAIIIIMVILSITQAPSDSRAPLPAAAEGRNIYDLMCVVCHDPDPTKDRVGGTSPGPAVAGSSLELLEMRVLGVEYPEGYTPKRDTNMMTSFPLAPTKIRALHAFLSDPSEARLSPPMWLIPMAIAVGLLLLMMFRRRENLPPRRAYLRRSGGLSPGGRGGAGLEKGPHRKLPPHVA